MRFIQNLWLAGPVVVGLLALAGCYSTQVDNSDLARGPAWLRMPSPAREQDCQSYEDSLTGGQVFSMYCSQCHNPPALSERNLANFKNVATHMRLRANLTGKEYAKLVEFLARVHDVPQANPAPAPSPKVFTFAQPIAELKGEAKAGDAAAAAPPAPALPLLPVPAGK
jgi:hypothetical protein